MSCHLRGSAGLRVMYVCRSRISVISPSVSFLLISIYVCARFMLMIVSMQTTLTLALGLRCYCVSFGSCGSCKPVRCGITNLSTSFTAASKRFRQWMCRCGAQPSTRCSTEFSSVQFPRYCILYGVSRERRLTPDSLDLTPFGNCIRTQAALEHWQQIAAVAGLQDYKSFT